jgi:hypothetical protein
MQQPAHRPAKDGNRNIKFERFDPRVDAHHLRFIAHHHQQADQSARQAGASEPP